MPAIPSRKTSVVRCKGCSCNIPSGTHGVPAQPVAVLCPVCGHRRMYLPVEVNLDRLHPGIALRAEG
jgi:DNA-directed RNA polymerase subunit RPC12/RpoP